MNLLFQLAWLIQQGFLIKSFEEKKVTTDTDLLIKVTDTNQKKMTNRPVIRAVLLYQNYFNKKS